MKKNDLISKWGYKDSSPFKNSKFLDINSSSITTKGVSIPLLLQPDGDPPVVAPPNSGEYYFPNSTKVRETPMKHGGFVSKWLGVYQDGGPLPLVLSKLSKEEYAKLYKEGRVATYDKQSDAYQPPVLPEATVSAKAPRSFGDFFDRYGKKKTAETSSLAQAMFAAPAEYLMGLPQAATSYLLDSEKNLEPSKALGIENKWGAIAADMVLDPTNLVGAGLLTKGRGLSKAASAANKTDDLVDLWRIQEKGSRKTADLASEGKLGPLFNNPDAIKHFEGREKHFGEWFTKDKTDLDFYKSDREFTDPEIINLKVPQSKLKEFQNYDKSLSRAPDREFVIPQDQQSVYRAAAPIVARASQSEYQRGGQVNNFISKWLT